MKSPRVHHFMALCALNPPASVSVPLQGRLVPFRSCRTAGSTLELMAGVQSIAKTPPPWVALSKGSSPQTRSFPEHFGTRPFSTEQRINSSNCSPWTRRARLISWRGGEGGLWDGSLQRLPLATRASAARARLLPSGKLGSSNYPARAALARGVGSRPVTHPLLNTTWWR